MHAQYLQEGTMSKQRHTEYSGVQLKVGCNLRGSLSTGKPYLFIHQGSNRKTVEAICENLPEPHIVPPLALIIEPVYPVDGCTFVITTEQEEIFWVLDLHTRNSQQ